MRDMSYFTKVDRKYYDEVVRDTNRHLRYHDYKHLRDVNFDEATEEHIAVKIMATMGFIMCLIVILFIA